MYYPIWLANATGVFEQAGLDVQLVDAPAAGYDVQDGLDVPTAFEGTLRT